MGLLAAILLMPATRFGYLLYPIAYAVWGLHCWTRNICTVLRPVRDSRVVEEQLGKQPG